MSWLAAFLFVSATILNVSVASFLSTIDEYKRVDSVNKAHKRHGPIIGTETPVPEDNDAGERPSYGADEGGELDCDAIMRQCQCGVGGGMGGGGEMGEGGAAQPEAQQQRKTFGFDEVSVASSDYPDRGNTEKQRGGRRRGN